MILTVIEMFLRRFAAVSVYRFDQLYLLKLEREDMPARTRAKFNLVGALW